LLPQIDSETLRFRVAMTVELPIQIIMGAFSLHFDQYMTVAAYTLQVYEWLACLDDEFLYIHKARMTSVKVAYLFCRYYPLLFYPVYTWAWAGNHSIPVCTKVVKPLYILHIFFLMSAQVVFVIRTYAFAGRNKFILAFLVACWMAILGSLLWAMSTQWFFVPDWHLLFGDSGCFAINDPSLGKSRISFEHHSFDSNAAVALATLLFDSLMTAIVVIHFIRFRTTWGRGSLAKAFFVQGLIAYVMLLGLNLLQVASFFSPGNLFDGLAILYNPTSDIIACRLILALRRRADPTATTQIRNMSHLVRGEMCRLEAVGGVLADDGENRAIEGWD